MKTSVRIGRGKFRVKELNRIMACAASLMLTGVPPVVCETVLDELYSSVRKSIVRIKV